MAQQKKKNTPFFVVCILTSGAYSYSISPSLLEELEKHQAPITRKLDPSKLQKVPTKFVPDAKTFHWCGLAHICAHDGCPIINHVACRQLNDNEMASFKLAEGIRKFAADLVKLEHSITTRIQASAPIAKM